MVQLYSDVGIYQVKKIDGFETISSRFEPLRSFGSALSKLSSQAEQQRQQG
jgi:hypothetical protein